MDLFSRRDLLRMVVLSAVGIVFGCRVPGSSPPPFSPTLSPTSTPTPLPPPDIVLARDSVANASVLSKKINLLYELASGEGRFLRVGAGNEVYRFSLTKLSNPGPLLMIQEEHTGEEKTLSFQGASIVLAGRRGEEGKREIELPNLRDLVSEARRRLAVQDGELREVLKKIAQEQIFQIGVTAAAIALGVWLLAKLGATILAALAGVAAFVLVLALAVAGIGVIKSLVGEAGVTTQDLLRFLQEGLEQIRKALGGAADALRSFKQDQQLSLLVDNS